MYIMIVCTISLSVFIKKSYQQWFLINNAEICILITDNYQTNVLHEKYLLKN